MSVQTIMSATVVSVDPTTTAREAIRLIDDSDVRHLPVVEDQRLVGIVSDRDLREYRGPLLPDEAFEPEDLERLEQLLDTPVAEFMNTEVISVDASESIESVIDAMLRYKVGAVPVVDEAAALVGIVSYIDVLRYARKLISAD